MNPPADIGRKPAGPLHYDVPLTVERDDVIAVLQHDHLDASSQLPLQMEGIRDVGAIIVTRMQEQHRLLDGAKLSTDCLRKPTQLQHGAPGRAQLPGL